MICHVSFIPVCGDYDGALIIITPFLEWQIILFWERQIVPTLEFRKQFWTISPTLELCFILKSKFRKVYKHVCILLPVSEWGIPKKAFLRHEKGSFHFGPFFMLGVQILITLSRGGYLWIPCPWQLCTQNVYSSFWKEQLQTWCTHNLHKQGSGLWSPPTAPTPWLFRLGRRQHCLHYLWF